MPERATILLVEDEIFTRRMMQIYFENDGYHVEQAGSAMEALDVLESKAVDLVLSDIMMPEVSGMELLRQIRERYTKEALPVILVTGMDDPKQILQAIALGANDFMTKTKEFRIVMARVALHLDWRRLKQQASGNLEIESVREPQEGAWQWNLKGGEVTYSNKWKEILGFREAQIQPNIDEWFSRIHPDDFARVSHALAAHQQGEADSFEEIYRVLNASQTYLWVKSFGLVTFGEDKQPLWMSGSLSALQMVEGLDAKKKQLENDLLGLRKTIDSLIQHLEPGLDKAYRELEEKAEALSQTITQML